MRRLGKSFAHPFVVVITLPNELEKIRIGVTAGKSVGGAVKRNRAKRIIRAAIQPMLPRLTSGNDIALVARKSINNKNSSQVSDVLQKLLTKAKILT